MASPSQWRGCWHPDVPQHANPRPGLPGPTGGCAPASDPPSLSFPPSQSCPTSALRTPAIRRGPTSAKTSWATSIASARMAGVAGSATEVRPGGLQKSSHGPLEQRKGPPGLREPHGCPMGLSTLDEKGSRVISPAVVGCQQRGCRRSPQDLVSTLGPWGLFWGQLGRTEALSAGGLCSALLVCGLARLCSGPVTAPPSLSSPTFSLHPPLHTWVPMEPAPWTVTTHGMAARPCPPHPRSGG